MASYYCQHIEKHFCKFLQIFVLVIKLDQKIYRVMARREVQSELIILKKINPNMGFTLVRLSMSGCYKSLKVL
jgi:hypothetical protein